jgi:ketosteroid isomerase-like protein
LNAALVRLASRILRGMPGPNVEALERIYQAFNRGDLPAMLADIDPEVEIEQGPSFPDERLSHGHEGVLEFYAGFLEAWAKFRAEPRELIEAGDKVLVVVRQRGRGSGSGLEVESDLYVVYTMREGKAVRMKVHEGRDAALADLRGNAEGADPQGRRPGPERPSFSR